MASHTPAHYTVSEGLIRSPGHTETPTLTISSHVLVSAPAALVFAIFRDTQTWPDWNSFVPECGVGQCAASVGAARPATQLHAGDALTMQVRMTPGASLRAQGGQVTDPVDEPDAADGVFRIRWAARGMAQLLLRTLRTTEVVPVGEGMCEFRTWEHMGGPVAYVVRAMYGTTLQERFEDCSRDIKEYAEQRYAAQGKAETS